MNELNLLFFAHYFSRLSPCYYYRLFFNIKRQTWGTYHLYGKTGNSGWKINRMVFVNGKHPCLRNRKTLKVVLCTKFCPACDKQVIASALFQLRINFTCIFKVFQILWKLWKYSWNKSLIALGPMQLRILNESTNVNQSARIFSSADFLNITCCKY